MESTKQALSELTDGELDAVAGGTPGIGVLTQGQAAVPNAGTANAYSHGGVGQAGNIPGEFGPGGGLYTAGKLGPS